MLEVLSYSPRDGKIRREFPPLCWEPKRICMRTYISTAHPGLDVTGPSILVLHDHFYLWKNAIDHIMQNTSSLLLQHLRCRRLQINFRASQTLNLDRDLFLNLGRVQNLSVNAVSLSDGQVANVSKHESGHRDLGNPVTTYTPNHPRAVFLEQLQIRGNRWPCNCDGIGYDHILMIYKTYTFSTLSYFSTKNSFGFSWTEKWLKRWRGVFCNHFEVLESTSHGQDPNRLCRSTLRDMRLASCKESKNNVLEDIKQRLECDTFNGSGTKMTDISVLATSLAFLTMAFRSQNQTG